MTLQSSGHGSSWTALAPCESRSEGGVAPFRCRLSFSTSPVDAIRDLKRVNSHLIEGAAYPVLTAKRALPPTRLRSAAKRS